MSSSVQRFRFRAVSAEGVVEKGVLAADSESTASRILLDRRLTPLDIARAPDPLFERPVPADQVALVLEGAALLTRDGVPIERALAAGESLTSNARLRDILPGIRQRLREGSTVADALSSESDIFGRVTVGVVSAGESGSHLSAALSSAAGHLRSEAELRSEVRAALVYPLIVAFVGCVTVLVFGLVVVPRFAAMLSDLGGELPASTRLVMSVSDAALWLGPLLFGLAGLLLILSRKAHGWERVDRALLSLPVVGRLRFDFATARSCRALGDMLRTGAPVLSALDAAANAAGDREIARRLELVKARLAEGETLAAALQGESAMAPLGLQLVAMGEATGEVASLCSTAGEICANDARRRLRTVVTLIEPALIIGLGIVVAVVAAGLLQAVYSVRPIP